MKMSSETCTTKSIACKGYKHFASWTILLVIVITDCFGIKQQVVYWKRKTKEEGSTNICVYTMILPQNKTANTFKQNTINPLV